MTKDQRPYCREILDRIRRIEVYTAAGREAFMESELLQDGVIRSGAMGAVSEIDFLVEFQAGYKLRDHVRLTQGLQRLLGRRVDVVDRRYLREEYRATILKEAQSL